MPEIDLNFTGVDLPSFTVLPEDDYRLCLAGLEIKPAKQGANLVAHCSWQVVGGEFDGKSFMTWQIVGNKEKPLSDMQKSYLRQWAEAITGDVLDGPFSLDTDAVIGNEVDAHVRIGTDNNDKDQNQIAYFIQ